MERARSQLSNDMRHAIGWTKPETDPVDVPLGPIGHWNGPHWAFQIMSWWSPQLTLLGLVCCLLFHEWSLPLSLARLWAFVMQCSQSSLCCLVVHVQYNDERVSDSALNVMTWGRTSIIGSKG